MLVESQLEQSEQSDYTICNSNLGIARAAVEIQQACEDLNVFLGTTSQRYINRTINDYGMSFAL